MLNNIKKENLVYKKENIYFAIILLISISGYIFLLFSVIGIVIILLLAVLSLFFHGIMLGGIRRNGVKLGENQFPDLYEKAVKTAKDLGLEKMPDIYILESEGILNAFATKFFRKNMVVLYASIFECIEKDAEKEVLFVLAHEFTHLKRKHIQMGFFVLPALWIPFLGNAYLRACEYTCDRTAAYYVQSYEAAKNALTMLAIGPEVYKKVNKQAYMEQLENESGFFTWFHEKLSTHPHLPKRIYAIESFYNFNEGQVLKEPKNGVIRGIILFVIALLLFIGLVAGALKLVKKLDLFSMLNDYETSFEETETPDYDAIVESGTVNEKDADGWTPLHYAVNSYDADAVQYLLENGANPNIKDEYLGSTVLHDAVYNYEGDTEIITLLLENGADIKIEDIDGYSALEYAEETGDNELIQILKQYSDSKEKN
ncbi:M48 family metallopeptidase [Niallia sp. 01092]|uniref:M48 family metallopeptidase n=1 Tax=unclassified Niallia TaxID=2837522 RepID=UPI003FD20814